jgi:predicted kinase
MPDILVFMGLIASGKSFLAEKFAKRQGTQYLNTDRVRKELAGIAATERRPDDLGLGIYTPEFTERTYQAMLDACEVELQAGNSIVLDGSYSKPSGRSKVIEYAQKNNAEAYFILCSCSEDTVKKRLELRARDPQAVSDGRWEIYLKQKESFELPNELAANRLLVLDTEKELNELLKEVTGWLTQV